MALLSTYMYMYHIFQTNGQDCFLLLKYIFTFITSWRVYKLDKCTNHGLENMIVGLIVQKKKVIKTCCLKNTALRLIV
jgi:hypothetical protein